MNHVELSDSVAAAFGRAVPMSFGTAWRPIRATRRKGGSGARREISTFRIYAWDPALFPGTRPRESGSSREIPGEAISG